MRKHQVAAAVAVACSSFCFTHAALAQGVATDAQLKPVVVSETRSSQLDPNLPSSTASKTATDLQEQNLFNPEDALRYLPSTTIRKRYFGDRNSNVGGRSYGVLEPGRALVYLDGYLISSFLGRFDAPRWNMVNNEAIERVDVLYGPFSAIYPGNSIGSTTVVTERKPQGFEASVSVKYNQQRFNEYNTHDNYGGSMSSARLAARLDSGLWYSLGLQHQDTTGQPMGFANVLRTDTCPQTSKTCWTATPAAGTLVSGIRYDNDPKGVARALFGATTIDHTVQDTINTRLGYDISRTQEIEGRVSWWNSKSQVRNQSNLKDAAGNTIWSGNVNDGVNYFTIPLGSATVPASGSYVTNPFAPSERDETHRQLGLTWKTKHAQGWNASVVATKYSILNDVNRQAAQADPLAANGGVGTATHREGTGWGTFEVQSTYTPVKDDFGNGNHALVVGLHRNSYQLKNIVNNATDWRSTETTLNQQYLGQTTVNAWYAQDAWRLSPDWLLTTGLRHEGFTSHDGYQFATGATAVTYGARSLSGNSPKASLAWTVWDDTLLKLSWGKGVRFPNVDELFNGTKSGNSIIQNNPSLKPERSTAMELAAEKFWNKHSLRASYFQDDVRDVILRQSDSTVTPSVTRVTNVDRVLTRGVELVWQSRDVVVKGLDVGGNATFTRSIVKENAALPASVGMRWLRIPPQRYTVQTAYRPNEQWLLSGAWRWHGRSFNDQLNADVNPQTYGGVSRVNQLDVRAAWRFTRGWEWAVGIDNLNNDKAHQAHSLPQRSFQTELRYSMK